MRNLSSDELAQAFPKLSADNHAIRSQANARYNCVAFAIGDERHWWQPGLIGGRYRWPQHVPQTDTVTAWAELFLSEGYEPTNSREVEGEFEKIAIFVDLRDMLPSHVAKSDGKTWKSKLGKGQDIEHSSLDILEGDQCNEYGIVERVLRRRITER